MFIWEYSHDFFSSVLETYHEPKNLKNILQEQVFQAAYMHVDQLLYLANSVDDFGYLPIDIYEVFSSEFKDASNNDFISALCVLQSFEPSGVGARTLSECLLIQLQDEANLQLIEKICTNHLPDVAIRDYELIAKTLQVEEEAILLAIEQIKTCNPRPGYQFITDKEIYLPDILIKVDNEISFSFRRSFDKLQVVKLNFDGMTQELQDYYNRAVRLQSAISRRNDTLSKIISYIVNKQSCFIKAEGPLVDLTQSEIAKFLNLSESTISRAISNKTVDVNGLVFELSSFFGVFSKESHKDRVGSVLTDIISNENKKRPLTDQLISEILVSKGFHLTRREVSKLRTELNILSSTERSGH